jgi:hypothetical protein
MPKQDRAIIYDNSAEYLYGKATKISSLRTTTQRAKNNNNTTLNPQLPEIKTFQPAHDIAPRTFQGQKKRSYTIHVFARPGTLRNMLAG